MVKHCGYLALIGRPNVGKSTLLNRFVGQKLSITASKPQTTRHRVIGISTQGDTQMLFVDTPGIHSGGKRALNRVLNRTALSAITDTDCVLCLFEPFGLQTDDQVIIKQLGDASVPIVAVVNKIDKIKHKAELLPRLAELQSYDFAQEIVPVSAYSKDSVENLRRILAKYLPEQEFIYPEDQLTDRSERFFAAELVREQLTRLLGQELPYALSVEVERFEIVDACYQVNVLIWVERDSQKGIVIGKNGSRLKEIGKYSREAMQTLFDSKVHLQTWVKVKQGWADDEKALRSLGYGDPV